MTRCNDRIVIRAMFDEAVKRGDEAEARVAELEEAIGVAVPVILKCFLEECEPDDAISFHVASGALARIEAAMAKRRPAAKEQA